MKNFKIFLSFIFAVLLTLGLAISFQSLLAAWTAPLSNPPACTTGNPGCDAPVSTGSNLMQQLQGSIYIANTAYQTNPYSLIVEQGKVGIGIVAPDYKLDVRDGQINSSGGYCINADCKTSWSEIVSAGTAGANTWAAEQTFSDVNISGTAALTLTQVTNDHFYIDSNEGVRITIDKDKNDTNSSFQINNGDNKTVFSVDETGLTTIYKADGTSIFSIDATGKITKGEVPWARIPATSYPTACTTGKYVTGLGATELACTALPTESGDAIVGNEVTDAANTTLTRSGDGLTTATAYKLALNLGNANAWTGVQTFSPSVTINGDLNMNGDINMAGGDIAEGFKVSGQVEPGDVLVINNKASGQLMKSSEPYQKTVAGVVSTDPAVKLGDKNQPQVALSGTVPVKVSGENGMINPGDMLTTSSLSGYAMKCLNQEKCFGAVLGKALEKFSGQTGVIKMLISLQ